MNVFVIGGGAAGMMAAISAAECGHNVTLIEQNEKLGKKVFITGKGRCNFTNACPSNELFDNIVTNKKFLYSAIYGFDNYAVMDFFELHGLDYKIERGNRVFPTSDHSSDVIKTLSDYMNMLSVKVMLNTKLTDIMHENNKITGIITNRGTFYADTVILAIGGKAYPSCGANGETFKIIRKLGIACENLEPSLVPFEIKEKYISSLQGLSLKNVSVRITKDGKKVYEDFGEMLFTHFGVSGPLILSGSCYLKEKDYKSNLKLFIDLKPALSEKQLDERILRDFDEGKNKQFKNSLNKLLPTKLIPIIVSLTGITPEKSVNTITREERLRLVSILKNLEMTIVGNRGFDEAIITRGGVDTNEINPKTMAVKKYSGLYAVGEMIDVDALTGGFNLQIAWSTGHLCGESLE